MSAPDTTLLTEHLSYRPAALIDDIINSINILAFKATDAVEKGLFSAPLSSIGFLPSSSTTFNPSDPSQSLTEAAKHEIENGVHQLETLLETKIDKNFDKLEVYALRNILSVPGEVRDWVRLAHYEGLDFGGEEGEGSNRGPDGEGIGDLRRRLRETLKLQVLLRVERERNERVLRGMRALLGVVREGEGGVKRDDGDMEGAQGEVCPTLAFLQNKGELKGDVKKPITTTTEFAMSQLPALKGLMEGLEPRLKELAEGVSGREKGALVGEEEKSWRRERLEFVELEAKRHLGSVRGLELGDMGEIRDGEWQGEGRRLAKGEVGGLERVVGMFRGGEGDSEGGGEDGR